MTATPAVHETASEVQIAEAPNGTLAHRNYHCPSLKCERASFAPNKMTHAATHYSDGNVAVERGLMKTINHIVKPPAAEASFFWYLRPEGGTFQGRV